MFFALGFLVAGFIAILLTPAFTRRAERLANRRMRAMFPVSLEEVAAERDHLRAGFAVTTRAMERKQAQALAEKATALADAGKQFALANTLRHERDAALEKLSTLETSHADRGASLDSALENLVAAARERDMAKKSLAETSVEKEALARAQAAATVRLDNQREAIAELEARIDALDAAGRQQQGRADQLTEALAVEKNAVKTLQEILASHRANSSRLTDRMAAMETSRDEARGAVRASEKLEAELRALRERLAQAQSEAETLRARLAANPGATEARAKQHAPAADAQQQLATEIGDLKTVLAGIPHFGANASLEAQSDALRRRIARVADVIMARPEPGETQPAAAATTTPAAAPARRSTRGGRGRVARSKSAP